MNLYELKNVYGQVQMLIEDGGEGLEDTLQSITDAIEDKAVGYAKVMRNLESQAMALKLEEDRLSNRRKSLETNIKRLKESLQQAMIDVDMKKIKTELFSFNIQKNPPSLQVLHENAIPLNYFIPQDPVLNKKAVLADLKNGVEVPGVEIKQGESLRIR